MRLTIVKLIKSIVLASLFSLLLYFLTGFPLAAILDGNPNKHFYISCWMLLLYNLSFYVIHERNRTETFSECDNQFTYSKELKSYFAAEGKYLLLLYGICAVIVEIGMLVSPENFNKSIGGIFAMFYPLTPYIPIPVVRSVTSLLLCMIGAVILVLLRSHKIAGTLKR